MAKVSNNIFVRGLSGNLGNQFVVKTDKSGRTVVSNKASFDNDREPSQAQSIQRQAFREAVAYAKDKKGEEIYIARANGGSRSPYNIAVADWFNRPEILEVDMSKWTNGSGGLIRVRAQDDVKVQQVRVMITDETGALLEEGEAQEVGALWWEYNTSLAAGDNQQVTISASDLPGHVAEWSELRGHPRMA